MTDPLMWSWRGNWGVKYLRVRRGFGRTAPTLAVVRPTGTSSWRPYLTAPGFEDVRLQPPLYHTPEAAKAAVEAWVEEHGL